MAEEKGIVVPLSEEMTDQWLGEFFFPEKQLEAKGIHLPESNKVQELAKPNVTLTLLHNEYETECRISGKIPYTYRSFCDYYNAFARKYKATMRIRRKPGEIMEVDWAGSTAYVVDRDTGEKIKAYVFVAALPCNQLAYAEAFLTMKSVSWIATHNYAFEYYGGSTDIIVPDNLKTGVKKNEGIDVILNESYRELGEHYGSIILPARVSIVSPKYKKITHLLVRIMNIRIPCDFSQVSGYFFIYYHMSLGYFSTKACTAPTRRCFDGCPGSVNP